MQSRKHDQNSQQHSLSFCVKSWLLNLVLIPLWEEHGAYPVVGRAWLNFSFGGKSQESIKEESIKRGPLHSPRSAVDNAKLTRLSCMCTSETVSNTPSTLGGKSRFHPSESFPLFSACLCKNRSMTRAASCIACSLMGRVGAYPSDSLCGKSMVHIPLWEEHEFCCHVCGAKS
jgi:hypothetical protein